MLKTFDKADDEHGNREYYIKTLHLHCVSGPDAYEYDDNINNHHMTEERYVPI